MKIWVVESQWDDGTWEPYDSLQWPSRDAARRDKADLSAEIAAAHKFPPGQFPRLRVRAYQRVEGSR